jgi:hypothetical protein
MEAVLSVCFHALLWILPHTHNFAQKPRNERELRVTSVERVQRTKQRPCRRCQFRIVLWLQRSQGKTLFRIRCSSGLHYSNLRNPQWMSHDFLLHLFRFFLVFTSVTYFGVLIWYVFPIRYLYWLHIVKTPTCFCLTRLSSGGVSYCTMLQVILTPTCRVSGYPRQVIKVESCLADYALFGQRYQQL